MKTNKTLYNMWTACNSEFPREWWDVCLGFIQLEGIRSQFIWCWARSPGHGSCGIYIPVRERRMNNSLKNQKSLRLFQAVVGAKKKVKSEEMVSLHPQQLSTSQIECASAQATLNFQQLHYQNLAHPGFLMPDHFMPAFFLSFLFFLIFFVAYEFGKIIFKPV